MTILRQQPLQKFNTLNISASADYYCVIEKPEQIAELASLHHYQIAEKMVLGGGSNLVLLGDIPGFVLHNKIKGIVKTQETSDSIDLKVGGGEIWHDLVAYCVERGWGGIENLALIPGTAGAAPVQNIGAYGVEIKDVLLRVECIELSSGQTIVLENAQCEFAYRDSIFKQTLKNKYLISAIVLRLQKQPVLKLAYGEISQQLKKLEIVMPTVRNVFDVICMIRSSKLPDPAQLPNAGSFFKNPLVPQLQFQQLAERYPAMPHYPAPDDQVKLAAGWLIEQAGWKGKAVGAVRMYEKQSLVLVNEGGSANDVLQLAQQVQQSVREKFNVSLEIEPEILPRQ